ncbi:hypothetical protein TWF696_008201 [Orbilia brochopaga]|uniref:Uncharacterized protein n=1 Tax=Orbilia brochopaga TaxID=3140254 RepID=A0AAV9UJ27_9PEZI
MASQARKGFEGHLSSACAEHERTENKPCESATNTEGTSTIDSALVGAPGESARNEGKSGDGETTETVSISAPQSAPQKRRPRRYRVPLEIPLSTIPKSPTHMPDGRPIAPLFAGGDPDPREECQEHRKQLLELLRSGQAPPEHVINIKAVINAIERDCKPADFYQNGAPVDIEDFLPYVPIYTATRVFDCFYQSANYAPTGHGSVHHQTDISNTRPDPSSSLQ